MEMPNDILLLIAEKSKICYYSRIHNSFWSKIYIINQFYRDNGEMAKKIGYNTLDDMYNSYLYT